MLKSEKFKFEAREYIKRYRDYLRKIRKIVWEKRLYINVNDTNFEKRCLLRYIVGPFRRKNPDVIGHQNQWQARQLAYVIGEFGYNVDVISYDDKKVELHGVYDLIIDMYPDRNPIYENNITHSSIKVAYLCISNPNFSNKAAQARIENLYQRRGVRLKPLRNTQPFEKDVLDSFDGAFFIGNEYNWFTYEEYSIPVVYYIRNNGYPELAQFDCSNKSSQKFLYLAGNGAVHKGLDLLLEIFACRPELDLYVCSRFSYEKDFYRLYKDQLFDTPNIHPLGFVDIFSAKLAELFRHCAYVILPSCSEGQAGSVLVGMSAGLIPLVSRETGFNDDEVFCFRENSLEGIGEAVDHFSKMPIEWVCNESHRAISMVQEHYSPSHYVKSVRQALAGVLKVDSCQTVEYR